MITSIRLKTLIATENMSIANRESAEAGAINKGLEVIKRRTGMTAISCCPPSQNIADFGTVLDQWNTAALAVVVQLLVFQAVAAPSSQQQGGRLL